MRKHFIALLVGGCALGLRADQVGVAKSAASYLDFSLGARAVALGQAQSAAMPDDMTAFHENPAVLGLLSQHSVATTTGLLGLDRNFYFAGYALPLRSWNQEQDFTLSEISSDSVFAQDNRHRDRWVKTTPHRDLTLAVGMTYFGIQDIQGRSEYGLRQADFQDAERTIYASFAGRLFENLSMGLTGKYLGQTLQSASARGFGFDVGVWYRLLWRRVGTWDFSLVGRDLGSKLKWTVEDPVLDAEYEYDEKVLNRGVLGLAYTTPSNRWSLYADLVKVHEQDVRLHNGVEWRPHPVFSLRAGQNAYDPSFGFGLLWDTSRVRLRMDYAFQYSLENLTNPHWITLSAAFGGRRSEPPPVQLQNVSYDLQPFSSNPSSWPTSPSEITAEDFNSLPQLIDPEEYKR